MTSAVGYRYETASRCTTSTAGAELALATSGGATEHPRFFDGTVGPPRAVAQALVTVAKVARTRFETSPRPAQLNAILDPIATAGDGTLRFESFSTCCGVYCRLDLEGDALRDAFCGTGTTNVDFNVPMRTALGAVTDRTPLRVEVGIDEVAVTARGARAVERKVALPDRWVRGLAEVHVILAGMVLRAELDSVGARRFLHALPAPTRQSFWLVPSGTGLRMAGRSDGEAIPLAGPHRIRPAAALGELIRGLRVYAPPPARRAGGGSDDIVTASAWEVLLDGGRLWLTVSPDVFRGFSGEGSALFSLALDLPGAADAAAGRLGFDPGTGRWFHRDLPFDRSVLERGNPRLRDARALVDTGAVEIVGEHQARVRSDDAVHRVSLEATTATCTCPWFAKHRGERGPCKHVLAATIVAIPATEIAWAAPI